MLVTLKGVKIKKEIKNSPGYFITDKGEVIGKQGYILKTFLKPDGYVRIGLPSLKHRKKVNRSVHLLVAEAFLNGGFYTNNKLQVNHIDGNKKNNCLSNLELVTGTENVNHAHNTGLYTYDLALDVIDKKTKKVLKFRSIRELSRFLDVSVNYIKPRMIISQTYPILGTYIVRFDYVKYIRHISKLKGEKKVYVYSYISKKRYILSSYSQISILFGLSYITIGKKLNKYPNKTVYEGGYEFSLNPIKDVTKWISKEKAEKDKDEIWKKLITST